MTVRSASRDGAIGVGTFLGVVWLVRLQGWPREGILDRFSLVVTPLALLGRWFRVPPPDSSPVLPLALAGIAGILVLAGALLRPDRRLHPILAAMGLAAAGQALLLKELLHSGLACWVLALGCLVLGRWRSTRAFDELPETDSAPGGGIILWGGALLFLAVALRLLWLGSYTEDPFTWERESVTGLMDVFERGLPALGERRTWGLGVLTRSHESLLYAAAVWLVTRMAGVTVAAVRSVSALVGLLDLWLLYRYARLDGRSRWAGLLGSSLLACMGWHLYFSRAGYYSAMTATAVLGAVVLARGALNGRLGSYAGLGVLLGLLPHLYSPSRVMIVLLPAFLLIPILLGPARWRSALGLGLTLLCMAAAVAVVVDDPGDAYRDFFEVRGGERIMDMVHSPHFMNEFLGGPLPMPPYSRELQLQGAKAIFLRNLGVLTRGLFGLDRIASFFSALPMDGLLLSPTLAIPVLLGIPLGLLTWRRRHGPGRLLWLYVLAPGLGIALLTNQVNLSRVHFALPWLAYAGALSLERLWIEGSSRARPWLRRGVGLSLAGLVGLLLCVEIGMFFQIPAGVPPIRQETHAILAAEEAIRQGARSLYFYVDDEPGWSQGWIRMRLMEPLLRDQKGRLEFASTPERLLRQLYLGEWPYPDAVVFLYNTPEVGTTLIEPLRGLDYPLTFIPGPSGPEVTASLPALRMREFALHAGLVP